MSNNLKNGEENRRKELINKLIAYGAFIKDKTQLFQLSLSELEKEYKKFQLNLHPHCTSGLRLINKR